ncbi:MAG: sugar phosphate isomerase/epimerase family protein [bacterium]
MKFLDKLDARIGLQILFDFDDVTDAIKFAKDNGFGNLELNLNNIGFWQQLGKSQERKKIRGFAENNDVRLLVHSPEGLSFFVPDQKIRTAALDSLKIIIDWSKELDIERVTFHLGSDLFFGMSGKRIATYEFFPDYFQKIITEVLTEIKKYAKDKTCVCVENVGGFRYPFVLEILDKLLGENLALTMDIGHIYRMSGEIRENEIAFFKDHKKFIKNCHIHDNNSEWDQHNIIGEGKIDFVPFFKMLVDTDSYLIFEVRPKESAVECLRRFNSIIVPKLVAPES